MEKTFWRNQTSKKGGIPERPAAFRDSPQSDEIRT